MTEPVKKFRNEYKYYVSANELSVIEMRLQPILRLDPYIDATRGHYTVKSLYFDDYDDNCLSDNEYSLGRRKKYRIRMYDDNTDLLLLEKKAKENSRSQKSSCRLTRQEFDQLYHGQVDDLYWASDKPLLREFALQIMYKRFAPKVIVRYQRTAFIDYPGNVRVTLDRNISCSPQNDRFLDNDYTVIPVLETGLHLLEVKYDEFLPDYVKQVIQLDTLDQTTFSKYYMGRVTSQQHGGI